LDVSSSLPEIGLSLQQQIASMEQHPTSNILECRANRQLFWGIFLITLSSGGVVGGGGNAMLGIRVVSIQLTHPQAPPGHDTMRERESHFLLDGMALSRTNCYNGLSS
jgi:hypothetical protein